MKKHDTQQTYHQDINMTSNQTQPIQISQRQHTMSMSMSPPLTNSVYFSPSYSSPSQQSQAVYNYRDTNSQQIHQFYQQQPQQQQQQYMYPSQQQQQQQQLPQPNMSDSYHSIMNNGQIKTYKIQRPYYQLEI